MTEGHNSHILATYAWRSASGLNMNIIIYGNINLTWQYMYMLEMTKITLYGVSVDWTIARFDKVLGMVHKVPLETLVSKWLVGGPAIGNNLNETNIFVTQYFYVITLVPGFTLSLMIERRVSLSLLLLGQTSKNTSFLKNFHIQLSLSSWLTLSFYKKIKSSITINNQLYIKCARTCLFFRFTSSMAFKKNKI